MKLLKPITIINSIALSIVVVLVLGRIILERSNDQESLLLANKLDQFPNLEVFFGTIVISAILGIFFYIRKDLISKKKWIAISLIPIIVFAVFFLFLIIYIFT